MNKTFGELAIGDKFLLNGIAYIKTPEVRISCCQTINCQNESDRNQTSYVPADAVVTVNG